MQVGGVLAAAVSLCVLVYVLYVCITESLLQRVDIYSNCCIHETELLICVKQLIVIPCISCMLGTVIMYRNICIGNSRLVHFLTVWGLQNICLVFESITVVPLVKQAVVVFTIPIVLIVSVGCCVCVFSWQGSCLCAWG